MKIIMTKKLINIGFELQINPSWWLKKSSLFVSDYEKQKECFIPILNNFFEFP